MRRNNRNKSDTDELERREIRRDEALNKRLWKDRKNLTYIG